MYVFFEHHRDAEGAVLATDVICSSFESGAGINWKSDKMNLELMTRLFKTPPIGVRSFNDKTKVWSYLGDAGMHLMETVQEFFQKLNVRIQFYEIEDLENSIGHISLNKAKKIDPSQFFYNRAIPTSQEITKEFATAWLTSFFGNDISKMTKDQAKKFYRAAAMRNHPDRGGDPKRMSELNMYWGVFSA